MTIPRPIQSVAFGAVTGTGATVGLSDGWEPPAPDNLILVVCAHSDGRAVLTTPGTYSTVDRNNGLVVAPRPTVAGFNKFASGAEDTVSVAWDLGGEWAGFVREYDRREMRLPLGRRASGGNGIDLTSLDSGKVADQLGFAFVCFASSEHNNETPTGSNAFRHVRTFKAGPAAGRLGLDLFVGDAFDELAGDYEMAASWSTAANRSSICIGANWRTVDGERLKPYQTRKNYKLVDAGTGIVRRFGQKQMIGLNYGQARKWHRRFGNSTNMVTE